MVAASALTEQLGQTARIWQLQPNGPLSRGLWVLSRFVFRGSLPRTTAGSGYGWLTL